MPKEISEEFFAVTKIRGKIAEENRIIAQICLEIGKKVYLEYMNGQAYSEEIAELCQNIKRHEVEKENQENDLAFFKEAKAEEVSEAEE